MDAEELKSRLGRNIAAYRKQENWTQAGLAERLNYSDKAVSKWERGESLPDVMTLIQLAGVFGVKVDDLLSDPDALPENTGKVEQAMSRVVEKTLKRKANKGIILMLSTILVWFVALLVYVVLSSLGFEQSAVAFAYAIPVTGIVLLSLRSAWRDFRWNRALISIIMWGSIFSIYITFRVFLDVRVWRLFLLGIPGQLAIFLWFRLFRKKESADG